MRIVVSGGGTGGHIMPAIAIAEAVQERHPEAEILYIGGSSGMETEIVPGAGVRFHAVTSRKLRKLVSPSTPGVILALFKGFVEARAVLKEFRADAVAGTGGYAAAATLLAANCLRVPTLVHEGNAVAGRTNLLLARSARRVCTTFAETLRQFPAGRSVQTGLPLRKTAVVQDGISPGQARAEFPTLSADVFTLFVTGGSQGARAINEALIGCLPDLIAAGVQIIHHTGNRNYDQTLQRTRDMGTGSGYYPAGFLDARMMPLAMRAASVMLCRGGVSTLAEGAANGTPMVIVPLPSAYADHQTANAVVMEKAGAAALEPEAGLTPKRLLKVVQDLAADPGRLAGMAAASRLAGRPRAAEATADELLKIL